MRAGDWGGKTPLPWGGGGATPRVWMRTTLPPTAGQRGGGGAGREAQGGGGGLVCKWTIISFERLWCPWSVGRPWALVPPATDWWPEAPWEEGEGGGGVCVLGPGEPPPEGTLGYGA